MNASSWTTFYSQHKLALLGLLFFACYLLGFTFPDFWWSTHFLAFLPNYLSITFILLAGGCFAYPFFRQSPLLPEKTLTSLSDKYGKAGIILISLLAGYAMYAFPIITDYFGDAYKITAQLDNKITTIPEGANDAFFKFSLSPWDGHTSVLAVITYIAYYGGLSYKSAFYVLNTLCGFLFVFSWLFFVRHSLKTGTARFLMGLAVLTAPFMLIFYGHIESYAPVFLFFSWWLMGLLLYLEHKNARVLWALVPGLLFCMKVHPVALLFVPALLICFVRQYGGKSKLNRRLSNWGGIGKWILAPIFLLGAILYFFVFEDHIDQRELNSVAIAFDRLFLPIFSPPPPLDSYNLLSFNHIFDYFSEMLLWSPILVFLWIAILGNKGKSLNWESEGMQLVGLTCLLFVALFFMVNPLLSMQMDWDLMALPVPCFLATSMLLFKQIEDKQLLGKALAPALGLGILCFSSFYLHNQKEALSQRYVSLGIRIYHSYYEWTQPVIKRGLKMIKYPSREAYEERKGNILKKLSPYARPMIDFEYARMLNEEGKFYSRVERDYDKALQYLLLAENYYPREKNGVLYRMETHFLRKEYDLAYKYSEVLIQQKYPSEKKSLAIAVQCALEAGLDNEALRITDYYLSKWQDNATLHQVNLGIRNGVPLDSLKILFAQGP